MSNENCIQVYNHHQRQLKTARPVASIIVGEHDVTRFVAKKNILVSGSKNYVSVWSMKDKSFSNLKTFVGHTKCVYCVDVLGDVILSGSRDRSIKVNLRLKC